MNDKLPCISCGRKTDWICERDDEPLCARCECVWLTHIAAYRHIPKGRGTRFFRYYMNLWPRHLPPPKTKERARAAVDIEPFIEHMLDVMCQNLAPAWDREDALMAIAEVAVRVHARDARVIDAWNDFVERERDKRTYRRLRGWKNNYYLRELTDDDRPDLILCLWCGIYKSPVEFYIKNGKRRNCIRCHESRRLELRYGITIDDYEYLLKKQNGVCYLCQRSNVRHKLHVDHDHKTGQVRGLLCVPCNRALGYYDDLKWRKRMILYLRRARMLGDDDRPADDRF